MELLIELNIILGFCGYLLPVPSVVLAAREWLKRTRIPPAKKWRRTASQVGFFLLCCGVALWIYARVREPWRHDYPYMALSARVGRWGSLGLIVISAFAERKLRRYLILGAMGLLFFFGVSIGDVAL